MAQTACSREEPHPKFGPVTRMPAPLVLRSVQLKVRVGRPVFKPPPIEEQKLSISRALNTFQELLRDNLVGIDVRAVKYGYVCG